MITEVRGDAVQALLNKDINYLLHICNCQGVMGSGIAKTIRESIPSAFIAYKAYEQKKGLLLGTVSSGGNVVNLHAQEFYGYDGERYLDYEALAKCLEITKKWLTHHPKETKIGLPFKMGCDRAGGSWVIVKAMLEHYLKDYEVIVYKL